MPLTKEYKADGQSSYYYCYPLIVPVTLSYVADGTRITSRRERETM